MKEGIQETKNAFVNANELSLVCTATAKLVTS